GTASQTVTIDIVGVNDAASISGKSTGTTNEDASTAVLGTLSVSDADDGEAHTLADSGTTAKGSWTVGANGHWSYLVNNAAENHRPAGVHDPDPFTVPSRAGTASQTVTIDIVGVNDAASISGTSTGSTSEDASTAATGSLSVSDADDGESHATAASG